MPRRSSRDWDDFYPVSTPRPVTDGLKVKNKRGVIGESWWSKRWLGVLESFGMGSRLTRGRSYARQGQVVSLDITPGLVKAKVQGSRPRPYLVTIELQPFSDKEWAKVTEVLAEQALFAAKLLAGEMPTTIEEAFGVINLTLFPRTEAELETDCNCPDFANPCKHIAAVYYVMADRFDENPFLLFQLRGKTQAELISALRAKRIATSSVDLQTPEILSEPKTANSNQNQNQLGVASASGVEESGLQALEKLNQILTGQATFITGREASEENEEKATRQNPLDIANFWEFNPQALEELAILEYNLAKPVVEAAVLKRLGKSPFKTPKTDLTTLLAVAYEKARLIAAQKKDG